MKYAIHDSFFLRKRSLYPGRIEHGFNVRPDLVAIDNNENPREYLKRFYYDAHVCDLYALTELVKLVGAERVMMGSDYPFPLGEAPPGRLYQIRHRIVKSCF